MELAVLPHLFDKIPTPPMWPGRRHRQPLEEYEDTEYKYTHDNDYFEDCKKLQDQEVSTLSSVAWELRNKGGSFPIPSLQVKWKSPDHVTFQSRKAAYEHAHGMAQREIQINKFY
jgi:hypothetical protein